MSISCDKSEEHYLSALVDESRRKVVETWLTPLGSLINVSGSFKRLIKSVISGKLLDAASPYHGFEEVGNYLYRFNKYEMEKFMMAMHRRIIATHEFNMIYEPGCEFVAMPPKSAQDARRVKRFKGN